MTEDPGKLSCSEFQAQLPELIGGGRRPSSSIPISKAASVAGPCSPILKTSPKLPVNLLPLRGTPDKVVEAN